jgi:two-component system LytT family response regulator
VEIIQKKKPDLVFLDIQMHKGTGFDLLEAIGNVNFEIIFVTAYDNYAVEAFKFSAFGYLLKPLKSKDLREVIQKLEHHIHEQKVGVNKRLNVLVENYGDEGQIRKLIVTNMEGFKVLTIESIIRLEGDRNYTHFIIDGERKVVTTKSLGTYEELLNDYGFLRIHQSTIINLRHVKGYIKGDGGKVEMTDGECMQVSRHRKAQLIERFAQ